MTTDTKSLAIVPTTVAEVQTLAELIGKSALLPDALRGKPADIIMSIMAGAELGLPPFASIRGVHIVSGKPILAAATMVGIVLGSGLAEYFSQVDATPTSVTFETKRRGAPAPQRCTWTIDDAKRAGIHKNTWLLYPRQMLAARASAELARSAYPDVCAGVYDPDEVAAGPQPVDSPRYEHAPDDGIIDAEIVGESSPLADIDAATDMDALKALVPFISKLPEATKKEARTRYAARLKFFEAQVPA